MKKRTMKMLTGLMLSVSILIPAACGGGTPNVNRKDTLIDYESAENRKTMKIGGWFTPNSYLPGWAIEEYGTDNYDEYILARYGSEEAYRTWLDEQYRMVKECGIDYLYYSNGASVRDRRVEDALEVSAANGVDMIVFLDNKVAEEPDVDYSEYDNCIGIAYYDEPPYTEFGRIAARIEDFERKYPGRVMANCLLPNYLTPSQAQGIYGGSYEEYIAKYCEEVLTKVSGTKWLAVDYYPFRPNGIRAGWLSNLEIVAKYGKLYGAHTHMAVQSGEFAGTRMPDEKAIRQQLYTTLAFGIDSLSYFMYYTQDWINANEGGSVSMVDSHGVKTDVYDAVKEVNAELRGFESAYLNFDWQGVIPVVGTENPNDRVTFSGIAEPAQISDTRILHGIESDRNLLASYFTDANGNEGYLLVNFTDTLKNQSAKLSADFGKCNRVILYRNGKKTIEELKEGRFEMELASGEGVFAIPFTE